MDFEIVECDSFEALMELLPRLDASVPTLIVNTKRNSAGVLAMAVSRAKGVVADFDGTLHPGNEWQLVRGLLIPDLARAVEQDLQDTYYGATSIRSRETNEAFIFRTVDRMVESGVTLASLTDIGESLTPRSWVPEFLKSFNPYNVLIVSFGLDPVIVSWCRWYYSERASIAALLLRYSLTTPARVVGAIEDSVVVDETKPDRVRIFRERRGFKPEETLVIGDSWTDLYMMEEGSTNILQLPSIDPQPGRMEERLASLRPGWARLNAIQLGNSFLPLAQVRGARVS
ncbi:MAG: HAD family hydrolase [Patescibacteria group bacterium]